MVRRLNLVDPDGTATRLRFHDRAGHGRAVQPAQPCKYDVVLDRLTHWFHTSREWIKKAVMMDGLYVLNNPWSVQSMEKHTSYCAMMKLGMPIPPTWMVPPKEHEPLPDVQPTLERYAQALRPRGSARSWATRSS
jgi:hypothetical protein